MLADEMGELLSCVYDVVMVLAALSLYEIDNGLECFAVLFSEYDVFDDHRIFVRSYKPYVSQVIRASTARTLRL